MTIDDYAAKKNLTYRQVYHAIKTGKLPAKKSGKSWIIEEVKRLEPIQQSIGPIQLNQAITALDIKIKQQKLEQEEIKTKRLKADLFSIGQVIEMLESIHSIVCDQCKATIMELIHNAKSK